MNFWSKHTSKHEGVVRCVALSMIVVASGLFISIPFFRGVRITIPQKQKNVFHLQNIEELCATTAKEHEWKYIVIHHSATAQGNAARFDDYHRNKRKWEYGLAYHFVIGNGTCSGDGEIEVSDRWKSQIHGAHAGNTDYNRVAIGICLVGDFENGGVPSENQFESLAHLVQYLSRKHGIPSTGILLHKDVHQKATACPGKNFPFEELKTRLIQIASKKSQTANQM